MSNFGVALETAKRIAGDTFKPDNSLAGFQEVGPGKNKLLVPKPSNTSLSAGEVGLPEVVPSGLKGKATQTATGLAVVSFDRPDGGSQGIYVPESRPVVKRVDQTILSDLEDKIGIAANSHHEQVILTTAEMADIHRNPIRLLTIQLDELYRLDPNPRFLILRDSLDKFVNLLSKRAQLLKEFSHFFELESADAEHFVTTQIKDVSNNPLVVAQLLLNGWASFNYDRSLITRIMGLLPTLTELGQNNDFDPGPESENKKLIESAIDFFSDYLNWALPLTEISITDEKTGQERLVYFEAINLEVLEPLINRVINAADANFLGDEDTNLSLNVLLMMVDGLIKDTKMIDRFTGTSEAFTCLSRLLIARRISKETAYSFLRKLEISNQSELESVLQFMDAEGDLQNPLALELYLRLLEVDKDALFVKEQEQRERELKDELKKSPLQLLHQLPQLMEKSRKIICGQVVFSDPPKIGMEIEFKLTDPRSRIENIEKMKLPYGFNAHRDMQDVSEITRSDHRLFFGLEYASSLVRLSNWLRIHSSRTSKTIHLHVDRSDDGICFYPDLFGLLFVAENDLGTYEFRELQPPYNGNSLDARDLISLINFVSDINLLFKAEMLPDCEQSFPVTLDKEISEYSKMELLFLYICACCPNTKIRYNLLMMMESCPEVFNTILLDMDKQILDDAYLKIGMSVELLERTFIEKINWAFTWQTEEIVSTDLPESKLIIAVEKVKSYIKRIFFRASAEKGASQIGEKIVRDTSEINLTNLSSSQLIMAIFSNADARRLILDEDSSLDFDINLLGFLVKMGFFDQNELLELKAKISEKVNFELLGSCLLSQFIPFIQKGLLSKDQEEFLISSFVEKFTDDPDQYYMKNLAFLSNMNSFNENYRAAIEEVLAALPLNNRVQCLKSLGNFGYNSDSIKSCVKQTITEVDRKGLRFDRINDLLKMIVGYKRFFSESEIASYIDKVVLATETEINVFVLANTGSLDDLSHFFDNLFLIIENSLANERQLLEISNFVFKKSSDPNNNEYRWRFVFYLAKIYRLLNKPIEELKSLLSNYDLSKVDSEDLHFLYKNGLISIGHLNSVLSLNHTLGRILPLISSD